MREINLLVLDAERTSGFNFIQCLKESTEYRHRTRIIGVSAHPISVFLSGADVIIPIASLGTMSLAQLSVMIQQRTGLGVDLIYETRSGQQMVRSSKESQEVPLFLPAPDIIDIAENKQKTYLHLRNNGLPVPETSLIGDCEDLTNVFSLMPDQNLWFRATEGKGSKGAFSSRSFEEARGKISASDGWGRFTAARQLPSHEALSWDQRLSSELHPGEMLTWSALFHGGRLVAAQSRKRLYFEHTDISINKLSFVGALMTLRCNKLHDLGMLVAESFNSPQNGAMGLDVMVDHDGSLCITEVQLGRFFSTTLHLARLGLNLPGKFVDAFFGEVEGEGLVDPLPEGMIWVQRFGAAGDIVSREKIMHAMAGGAFLS